MKPRVIVPTLGAVADAMVDPDVWRNLLYKTACQMWADRTKKLIKTSKPKR